jgi:hypothetical protein
MPGWIVGGFVMGRIGAGRALAKWKAFPSLALRASKVAVGRVKARSASEGDGCKPTAARGVRNPLGCRGWIADGFATGR